MPSVFIPTPEFPDVPRKAGVPQLVRAAKQVVTPILSIINKVLLVKLWAASKAAPVWGVFDSTGKQVLNPTNIYSFDNRNEWSLPDFPIQNGSFATYNKVVKPFEVPLRMTKGGTLSDRSNFLQQIADIAGDTNLYTVITPERSYQSVNLMHYEVTRRSSEGAFYLAEVDIYFRQILQQPQYTSSMVAGANTSNASNPAAVPPYNQGNVQPQSLVPQDAQSIAATAVAGTIS